MGSDASTRFLHVANGTSTTVTIQAAGIPGSCSIWADPLYEGPVPGGLNDDELVEVRREHLAGPPDPARPAWARINPLRDARNDPRLWRAAMLRDDSYDELILWFEHDLFDQLNLVQLLAWIADNLPSTTPVSLICIGSFPGRPDFKGLGELMAEELAPLLETRQLVDAAQYELARRTWQAFRQPTPEALDALRRDDTSALPFLAPALERFLQEYPWTRDGLSRTERRLLELAVGSEIELRRAFPRMHDGERAYYVTDRSLAAMAESLSHSTPPLLTFEVPADEKSAGLRGTISLTDDGRSILAGQRDRITSCGIDRWLGGVRLQNGRRIWRWDENRQRIA
jgi:hypothetical protein